MNGGFSHGRIICRSRYTRLIRIRPRCGISGFATAIMFDKFFIDLAEIASERPSGPPNKTSGSLLSAKSLVDSIALNHCSRASPRFLFYVDFLQRGLQPQCDQSNPSENRDSRSTENWRSIRVARSQWYQKIRLKW